MTGDLTVASAKVEGKTVKLTLAAQATQQKNVELTVQNVKDANGVAIEETTKSIRFFDTAAPTVTAVQAIGPKTVKVNFSEPLKTAPSYRLDNGTVAIVTSNWTQGSSEAVLTLGTDLTEGSHSLEVSGGADYADFAVEKVTQTFNYVKDVTAPTAVVKSASETQVVLEFSEDVLYADSDTNSNVSYYHTYKGTPAYKASDVSVDGNEVTLTFTNPLPAGSAKIFVAYGSNTGTKIQDATGNVFEETTLTANVVADVTAPTVSKVVVTDNTKLDVTFSESVSGADNKANYTLKDAAGDVVALSDVSHLNGNTYRITTPALNGGAYTLTVKDVTDTSIRKNEMADYTTNLTVADVVPPTIVDTDSVTGGVQVKQVAPNKVKISFSEVMNASSITNKANYKFNNASLAAKDKVEAVDGNKAVIVTIDAGVTDQDSITVGRVQDVAGNYIEKFETQLDIVALANVGVAKVEVTGKNSIRLTFDEVITNATVEDFRYTLDDTVAAGETVSWLKPGAISTSVSNGKTYITLTTADITDTTAAEVAVKTVGPNAQGAIVDGPTAGAENAFGTPVEFAETDAEDKYAPTMVSGVLSDSVETAAGGIADGKYDTVTLTYSEDLYVASVQESDFTVSGYTVAGVKVVDNVVTLTLTENDANSTTVDVKQVGEVEDALRNVKKAGQVLTGVTLAPQQN